MKANGMRLLFLLSLALGIVLGRITMPKEESPAVKKKVRSRRSGRRR